MIGACPARPARRGGRLAGPAHRRRRAAATACRSSPPPARYRPRSRLAGSPPAAIASASRRHPTGTVVRIMLRRCGSTSIRPCISMCMRVAEPLAIVPVTRRAVGGEGHRGGRLRRDLHRDAVVDDGEAVGEVLHVVDVGDVDRHLVALLDLELLQAERGRRSSTCRPAPCCRRG